MYGNFHQLKIDLGVRIDISIDPLVTWRNVRCSVAISPDMCMGISIDLLLTWQNERCPVLIYPDMCMEISVDPPLT